MQNIAALKLSTRSSAGKENLKIKELFYEKVISTLFHLELPSINYAWSSFSVGCNRGTAMRLIVSSSSSSSSSRTVSSRTKWTHIMCEPHCTKPFVTITQTKEMRQNLCEQALRIFNLCKILLLFAMYNVRLSLFFRIQKQVS